MRATRCILVLAATPRPPDPFAATIDRGAVRDALFALVRGAGADAVLLLPDDPLLRALAEGAAARLPRAPRILSVRDAVGSVPVPVAVVVIGGGAPELAAARAAAADHTHLIPIAVTGGAARALHEADPGHPQARLRAEAPERGVIANLLWHGRSPILA